MKNNWQTKKLEDCLDKVIYTDKVQRKDFLESGAFPIISQEADFINGYWNNKKDLFRIKKSVIIFGDHTKVLKYVDFDFVLGADGVKILSPKDFLDSRFFYYFLQGVDLKNLGYARHYRLLKEIEIPLPPLPIQHRIVKTLDEVFEKTAQAKENAEKNLQNAKDLFESYLQSIFANLEKDWEEKKLGELCEVITKGTTPTSMGFKFVEKGINFIKIESITSDGKFIPHKFAAITEECHKVFKRSQLKKGDILFSIAGALGRTAFVEEDILPANTNQALAIVRLKLANNVLPKFVLLFLNSGLILGQISKFRGGVAQQNLSLEQLKNFKILLPLPCEQKTIVAKIDALSAETKKLEAIYKQKLADLEELKKSVLKKAFSGEL